MTMASDTSTMDEFSEAFEVNDCDGHGPISVVEIKLVAKVATRIQGPVAA